MSFVNFASLRRLVIVGGFVALPATAAGGNDVHSLAVDDANVADVREAVIEAIESAGLVVSATIPFNRMLERTGKALEYHLIPYIDAETVQFCSTRLAWQLVTEDPSQLALCPMSISIYATTAEPKLVRLAYRSLGEQTPSRQRGDQLLRELIERAVVLAGWHRR